MARKAMRAGLGSLAIGMAWGAMPLAAQAFGLPASDAVGIGRSGAQVAFGRSLEAATLNPALLASLAEPLEAYVSLGYEGQIAQETITSNQKINSTDDRGRTLAALGLGWRLSPAFALGLKVDRPYLRHGTLPDATPSRFLGRRLDIGTRREEFQLSWAHDPRLSFGLGLGVAQMTYESASTLRVKVPNEGGANAGLLEQDVRQDGRKTVPSWSMGFRFAINPRWTVGGVYQSALKADLGLRASLATGRVPVYTDLDGLGPADVGIEKAGADLLARSSAVAGSGRLSLPATASVGVRQRVNQIFTWEADLHYVGAASLSVPSQARMQTPYELSRRVGEPIEGRNTLGLRAMGEVSLGKRITLRIGMSLDPPTVKESQIEPLVGGVSQAGFSFGAGYRIWGGELNIGYQFRQSKDEDSQSLNGAWDQSGYRPEATTARVEGMGHLVSVGFRMAF